MKQQSKWLSVSELKERISTLKVWLNQNEGHFHSEVVRGELQYYELQFDRISDSGELYAENHHPTSTYTQIKEGRL